MSYTYYPHVAKQQKPEKPKAAEPNASDDCYTYKPSAPAVPAKPTPVAQSFPYVAVMQPQHGISAMYAYQYALQNPQMCAVQYPAAAASYYQPAAAAPAPAAAKTPDGTSANPYVWKGNSKAEVDRQNTVIAQNTGATAPHPLIPAKATNSNMWWCREHDGSYTLRSTNTITESLQPGYWAYAQNGGYPYFIRT